MLEPIRTSAPTPAASGAEASNVQKAAQGFEHQLVELLARRLVATAQPDDSGDGEDGDGTTADASMLRDLLPGTLADAVEAAGGIGLGAELQRALAQRQETRS